MLNVKVEEKELVDISLILVNIISLYYLVYFCICR